MLGRHEVLREGDMNSHVHPVALRIKNPIASPVVGVITHHDATPGLEIKLLAEPLLHLHISPAAKGSEVAEVRILAIQAMIRGVTVKR